MIYLILTILFLLFIIRIKEPFGTEVKIYNIETDNHDIDVGYAQLPNYPDSIYYNSSYRPSQQTAISDFVYMHVPCSSQTRDKYKIIASNEGAKYFDLNCYKIM